MEPIPRFEIDIAPPWLEWAWRLMWFSLLGVVLLAVWLPVGEPSVLEILWSGR